MIAAPVRRAGRSLRPRRPAMGVRSAVFGPQQSRTSGRFARCVSLRSEWQYVCHPEEGRKPDARIGRACGRFPRSISLRSQ